MSQIYVLLHVVLSICMYFKETRINAGPIHHCLFGSPLQIWLLFWCPVMMYLSFWKGPQKSRFLHQKGPLSSKIGHDRCLGVPCAKLKTQRSDISCVQSWWCQKFWWVPSKIGFLAQKRHFRPQKEPLWPFWAKKGPAEWPNGHPPELWICQKLLWYVLTVCQHRNECCWAKKGMLYGCSVK